MAKIILARLCRIAWAQNLVLLCLLTIVVFGSMVAAQAQEPSLWDHNDSLMYLIARGSIRAFYYKEPRPGIWEAGARPGSLLFRGDSNDVNYSGTAYTFNRRCGRFPYQVSGPTLDNQRRVVLHGLAPRIGSNCHVIGHLPDTLELKLLRSGEPGETMPPGIPNPAPALPLPDSMPKVSGGWKPLSSDDRLMTIRRFRDKITIEARDLSCTLTELVPQKADDPASPPSITASSVCDDESDTIYAKETLTILQAPEDVFLLDATVPLRHVNERRNRASTRPTRTIRP